MKLSSNRYLATTIQGFKTLNAFEIALMCAILALAVASFVIKGEYSTNNCIAAISAVLGVFCVVFGAKGSMVNWIFGIFECFLHAYICIMGHIYGDALQRILYTLPMQFIGWHLWAKRERGDGSTQIVTRYMTWKVRAIYATCIVIMTLAFGFFLKFVGPHLTDFFEYMHFKVQPNYSNEAQLWIDSFTTVMFLVAMVASVKAYVEQWHIWLIINIASIAIWAMNSSDFSFMTISKYSVYTINSIYGIWMWHKLSKTAQA